jgi:hypothetical protein
MKRNAKEGREDIKRQCIRRFFYRDFPLVLNKGGFGKDAVATKVPTVITRGALSENCFLVLFD